jgi:hypothetical protein
VRRRPSRADAGADAPAQRLRYRCGTPPPAPKLRKGAFMGVSRRYLSLETFTSFGHSDPVKLSAVAARPRLRRR